jgi:hypothetical protein
MNRRETFWITWILVPYPMHAQHIWHSYTAYVLIISLISLALHHAINFDFKVRNLETALLIRSHLNYFRCMLISALLIALKPLEALRHFKRSRRAKGSVHYISIVLLRHIFIIILIFLLVDFGGNSNFAERISTFYVTAWSIWSSLMLVLCCLYSPETVVRNPHKYPQVLLSRGRQ